MPKGLQKSPSQQTPEGGKVEDPDDWELEREEELRELPLEGSTTTDRDELEEREDPEERELPEEGGGHVLVSVHMPSTHSLSGQHICPPEVIVQEMNGQSRSV